MGWDDLQGVLRHVLTAAGGALVTDGLLTSQQVDDGAGAVVALLGIAWSLWNKVQHRKALAAAGAK